MTTDTLTGEIETLAKIMTDVALEISSSEPAAAKKLLLAASGSKWLVKEARKEKR